MTVSLTPTALEQIRELRLTDVHRVSVADVDRLAAMLRDLDAMWTGIQNRLLAEMPSDEERETRDVVYRKRDLKSDLMITSRGPSAFFGATDPEIAALPVWLPGKAEVVRLLDKLEQLRDRIVARQNEPAWPRKFRYTGKPRKADFGGRLLKSGDVVLLTEAQASAFADRFEPAS